MRAIEKTTKLFVECVKDALPTASVRVQKSVTAHGRSNYVYIDHPNMRFGRALKIRISDHAIGMRRAKYGEEDLHLHDRARPHNWAVWLSGIVKTYGKTHDTSTA